MTETKTTIRLMTFSAATLHDYVSSDVDDILSKVGEDEYAWIHVAAVDDAVTSARVLGYFGLPLSLAQQIEGSVPLESETSSESYLFKKFRIIAQTSAASPATPEREASSFLIRRGETDRFEEAGGTVILGKKFLLLFEDQRAPQLIAEVRTEILSRKNEIQQGVDHLLYWFMRILFIDNYLSLFRQFMERLKDAEDILLGGATDSQVYRDVVRLRRELNPFERSLLYGGDFAGILMHEKPHVLSEASISFFSENLVSDGAKLEKEFSLLRDRTSELMQMYRDNSDTQLNNTMRTLTVISSIFLPLNFICAFYGMNFPNMPAVKWNGSFPIVVGVMVLLVAGSLIYARKHKWL